MKTSSNTSNQIKVEHSSAIAASLTDFDLSNTLNENIKIENLDTHLSPSMDSSSDGKTIIEDVEVVDIKNSDRNVIAKKSDGDYPEEKKLVAKLRGSDGDYPDEKTLVAKFRDQLTKLALLASDIVGKKLELMAQDAWDINDSRLLTLAKQEKMINDQMAIVRTYIDSLSKVNERQEVPIKKDKITTIPTAEVPIFNVDPTPSGLNYNTDAEKDVITLSTFILQFERVFTNYKVNINDNWLFYLTISFEKAPKHFSWFVIHLKESTKNVTWENAKAILKTRFDPTSRTSVHTLAMKLVAFSQDENETFISNLERYRMLILDSKIPYHDNIVLVYTFIQSFQQKAIRDKIYQILRSEFCSTNPRAAIDSKVHFTPVNWAEFERIIFRYTVKIQEMLSKNTLNSNNSKKRKLSLENEQSSGPSDLNVNSNPVTLCSYCKTESCTHDHGANCEAEKEQ